MKNKVLAMCVICMCVCMFTGCATNVPVGGIYTQLKLPLDTTSNGAKSPKVGTAECISVLTLIAIGDASIETAKQNGGITKVHHVDWDVENILGVYGKYKVIVYGE